MKIENLNIKVPQKGILIDGQAINIKQYLSTQDKIKMIIAIQDECLNTEIISQPKLDAYFNALIIVNYTDIEIENFEVDSLIELYDYFEINDYMKIIINAIPKNEYEALIEYLKNTINDYNRYKASILGAVEGIVSIAPALMEKVNEISKDIDMNALKTVSEIYSKVK